MPTIMFGLCEECAISTSTPNCPIHTSYDTIQQHFMLTFATVLGSITSLCLIDCLAGLTSSDLQKVPYRQDLKDLSIVFATVSPVLGCQRKCPVMGVLNSSAQILRTFYCSRVFVTVLRRPCRSRCKIYKMTPPITY